MSRPGDAAGGANRQAGVVIAERVFEQMVEFSRKSAWLLQSASRLNFWFTPPWMTLSIDSVSFDGSNKNGLDHLNVSPALSTVAQIESEAVNQIKAYQNIRD